MDPRISYVLDTFRHLYRVPREVRIVYGDNLPLESKTIQIHDHAGNFFERRNAIDPEHLVFKLWKNTSIPFLFSDTDTPDLMKQTSYGMAIPYDILGGAFYFLSGWQEYVTNRSAYVDGRFPYNNSLQSHLEAPHIPWVNYYFDILKTAVEQVYDIKLSPRKGSGTFTLAVTHDIDTLYTGWLEEGFSALKQGEYFSSLQILIQRLTGRDPWFNLGTVQALNDEFGVKGSFYFLTNTDSVNGKKQADYQIESPPLKRQIQLLEQAGAEIGIHGSIGSHLSAGLLKKEISRLDTKITGGRFHYLYYDARTTPEVLQEAGLQYDSTLGFAEQVGFRNAYAHPFYLYDLELNRQTDVLEIPLVVMDATLRNERYMDKKPEKAFEEMLPLLQELRKFNGAAAILWHNSYFSDFKYAGWKEVYIKLLNYCKEQNGSAVSASEIVPYYMFQN